MDTSTCVCANCEGMIGKLESPQEWYGHLVCAACHARLATPKRATQQQKATRNKWIRGKAGNMLLVIAVLGWIGSGASLIYSTKQESQAASVLQQLSSQESQVNGVFQQMAMQQAQMQAQIAQTVARIDMAASAIVLGISALSSGLAVALNEIHRQLRVDSANMMGYA